MKKPIPRSELHRDRNFPRRGARGWQSYLVPLPSREPTMEARTLGPCLPTNKRPSIAAANEPEFYPSYLPSTSTLQQPCSAKQIVGRAPKKQAFEPPAENTLGERKDKGHNETSVWSTSLTRLQTTNRPLPITQSLLSSAKLGPKGRREENNTKETKIPRKYRSSAARRVDVR